MKARCVHGRIWFRACEMCEEDSFSLFPGLTPMMVKAITVPMPNFHKTYREYREWMAKQAPVREWPGFEWFSDLQFGNREPDTDPVK